MDDRQHEEIYLVDIFNKLVSKYKVIIFYLVAGIIFSLVFAITRPNIYQSSSILKPANFSSSNNIDSSISSAASIVGIKIPSSGDTNRSDEGIEVIKSLDFLKILIENNENILFNIAAVKSWNGGELEIDSDIDDVERKKWIDTSEFSQNGQPSLQKIHKLYKENLSVSKSLETGFIKISYSHYSPDFAKEILDEIIVQVNRKFRQEDIEFYNKSIIYLKDELTKTQLYDVKLSFNNILQDNIAKLLLANSTEQYLFKVLANPYAPEYKSSPSRTLILIIGSIVGFLFGCAHVIFKYFILRK